VSDERIVAAMSALVERLAMDPTKQRLRIGLGGLVHPNVSGNTGLALIATVVLDLAAKPLTPTRRDRPVPKPMDWLLQHRDFLDPAFAWLKDQEPIVIGRVALPRTLLTKPADEVVSAVAEYLSHAPVGAEDDIASLRFWLTFATSVTPYCTDPDCDLLLMRIVGGKFASSGYMQLARDLAEQTLLNCAASSRRRRLGWFAMADIYHRCQLP
jgi:hypothetical protein